MNIDSNTLVTLITLAGDAYLAVAYFRTRLNEKFNNMARHNEDQVSDLYRENEKMWQRIMSLEKCCKSEKCSTNKDNYYNTTA